ncbi:hypothetical protein [Leucobacter sp. NPDC077196]|uniref:hypothetical protein n=1 Tax=Leucobacter sp. NPDC077196 TaxID=3154959 RepID=UPI00341B29DB
MPKAKWKTASEVAAELGYNRSNITRMANKGFIRGQKAHQGKTAPWLFSEKAVEDAKKRMEAVQS